MIVVGAGLAGSALAWQAHWRGWSLAIVDRLDVHTPSRVAAGLVTPVTGPRSAAGWRWNEFFPVADRFYRRVEKATSNHFWKVEPSLRVFRSERERELYQSRWMARGEVHDQSLRVRMCADACLINFKIPFGVCCVEPSARLSSLDYLAATQQYFEKLDSVYVVDLDCDSHVSIQGSHNEFAIGVNPLELQGKRIAFCQGLAARENRFFADLPLHPARGDILLVESPDVKCDRVVHHDAWTVPVGGEKFLVGATYSRLGFNYHGETDNDSANRFRMELMQRWESLAHGTFLEGQHVVVEQKWAVRPASYDRHPLIGQHEEYSNVFCLNGLGSKGSLMAPRLADMVVHAMEGSTIDPTMLWSRRNK